MRWYGWGKESTWLQTHSFPQTHISISFYDVHEPLAAPLFLIAHDASSHGSLVPHPLTAAPVTWPWVLSLGQEDCVRCVEDDPEIWLLSWSTQALSVVQIQLNAMDFNWRREEDCFAGSLRRTPISMIRYVRMYVCMYTYPYITCTERTKSILILQLIKH